MGPMFTILRLLPCNMVRSTGPIPAELRHAFQNNNQRIFSVGKCMGFLGLSEYRASPTSMDYHVDSQYMSIWTVQYIPHFDTHPYQIQLVASKSHIFPTSGWCLGCGLTNSCTSFRSQMVKTELKLASSPHMGCAPSMGLKVNWHFKLWQNIWTYEPPCDSEAALNNNIRGAKVQPSCQSS